MDMNLKLPEVPKLPKIKKGKIPTKNYINVLVKKKQPFSIQKNLPLIIVLVILFLVLFKFAMFDRLAKIIIDTNKVSTMQEEIADINSKINAMKGVEDQYAHYTTSGMTAEELGRVDRVKAMKLINKQFMRANVCRSWNLTGNVMTLKVNGPSLRELNQTAAELEENDIVERCVISTADKRLAEGYDVVVTFIIYLKQPDKEE